MHFETIKLKNGQVRWIATADGPPDSATGKRKQIQRRAKSKGEAKKKVEAEIEKMESSGYSDKELRTKTFESVAKDWLQVYALSGVKRGSVRVREKDLAVLYKFIAKTPINKIDHRSYQRIINELANVYSRNYIKSINTTAGLVFGFARRSKLMTDDPKDGVSLPKKIKTVEEIKQNEIDEKYLDHEELDEFFNVLKKNALELDLERFYLFAFSGMRPGELCALQKDDLNFEENTISIYKTLYNEKNNMKSYELNTPKTTGSIRTIDMEPHIMKMLKALVRSNDERKMRLRTQIDDFHDKDFLFSRPNGYPYITKIVSNRMERIMSMTNINKKATPHIFRHTHISMMTEAGIDLPTIMKRVGHEDVATTMKVYTHVTEKMKKNAPVQVSNLHENILRKVFS